MKIILAVLIILSSASVFAQKQSIETKKSNKLSINGFRNPSIGLEFQMKNISLHAGYYMTALKSGETTSFIKVGVTHWVLPVDKKEVPSSFYVSASYLRGLNRDYKGDNAIATEVGFRWTIIEGLNARLGVTALASPDKNLKINPTPGISYTFSLK